jgi:hypothetical protein
MTWEHLLGASVLALVYVRTGWMIVHPRHARIAPPAQVR